MCVSTFQARYCEDIPIVIKQNPDFQLALSVAGQGVEPEIIFSSAVLQFGPVLPYSSGATQEVTVSNPTDNPLEIYSLEFDTQYREEEEVRNSSNLYM